MFARFVGQLQDIPDFSAKAFYISNVIIDEIIDGKYTFQQALERVKKLPAHPEEQVKMRKNKK
jgi:hypothetical protein